MIIDITIFILIINKSMNNVNTLFIFKVTFSHIISLLLHEFSNIISFFSIFKYQFNFISSSSSLSFLFIKTYSMISWLSFHSFVIIWYNKLSFNFLYSFSIFLFLFFDNHVSFDNQSIWAKSKFANSGIFYNNFWWSLINSFILIILSSIMNIWHLHSLKSIQ